MFCVQIAGVLVAIENRYAFTEQLCADYIVDVSPDECDFSVSATAEEIVAENNNEDAFSPAYCESLALYRKICTRMLDYDAFLFHAAVVSYAGRGYAFAAKSGTGKSTHSRLWLKFIPDTALLNDDNPVVRLMPDGTVRVFGTPWSGKTPCYINRSVPVGAFVRLFQAPENKIERMQPPLSGASIIGSASGMRWDKEFYTRMLQLSFGIAKQTGIFTLHCLPDEEAARICHAAVTR